MRSCLFAFLLALPVMGAYCQSPASHPKLAITHLTGNFYVYTTWKKLDNGPVVPSNSMYVVTDKGVVMIDGPWDSTQFRPFLDSIYARHRQKAVLCIATHFHADRSGALDFLRAQGIPTYSTALTRELCRQNKLPQAEFVFTGDTTFRVGDLAFEVFYPGEGHTRDNIVVWFPSGKVLYGGCFVKSTEADDLGNVADANVAAWPRSARRVMDRYPEAAFIIPGHYGWSDPRSLQHTLELAQKAKPR